MEPSGLYARLCHAFLVFRVYFCFNVYFSQMPCMHVTGNYFSDISQYTIYNKLQKYLTFFA